MLISFNIFQYQCGYLLTSVLISFNINVDIFQYWYFFNINFEIFQYQYYIFKYQCWYLSYITIFWLPASLSFLSLSHLSPFCFFLFSSLLIRLHSLCFWLTHWRLFMSLNFQIDWRTQNAKFQLPVNIPQILEKLRNIRRFYNCNDGLIYNAKDILKVYQIALGS